MTDDPYEKYDPPVSPWWTGRPSRWMRCRDGNPLHVWEALALAEDWEMPLPVWVVKYLFRGARECMSIRAEVLAQQPLPDEAERVGRALGFGVERGKSSKFREAALLKRDEELFSAVMKAVDPVLHDTRGMQYFAPREKLDRAYDMVAEEWGMDRSTVVRAAIRFLRRRQPIADEHGQRFSTMAQFLAWRFECLNESIRMMAEAREAERDQQN